MTFISLLLGTFVSILIIVELFVPFNVGEMEITREKYEKLLEIMHDINGPDTRTKNKFIKVGNASVFLSEFNQNRIRNKIKESLIDNKITRIEYNSISSLLWDMKNKRSVTNDTFDFKKMLQQEIQSDENKTL